MKMINTIALVLSGAGILGYAIEGDWGEVLWFAFLFLGNMAVRGLAECD